jgi:phosphohistidine swiveling domain-containing protein
MLTRERARGAVVRMTHALRLTLRERGRRLAAAGIIEQADDVWYLTFAELRSPPADMTATVARRREERTRLGAIRLPAMFDGHWEPEAGIADRLESGASITGIPASPGVVRGPVRLLSADTLADLEVGEVLVANTTDTGWTPLFAFAAAIVTDVGAQISHAAVVAREYGIPAVVGTRTATRCLRDGQQVEVDGAAGTVTALD